MFSRPRVVIDALFRYRNCVAIALLFASVLNSVLRFNGGWGRFFLMIVVQLLFVQAVWNYLRGARIAIGPSSLGKDANPEWRAALAVFSFILYVIVFFLDFERGL
jgi:hypothetical protein